MFCWTRDITVWKSAWMTSAQLWSRHHHWPWADVIRADFQTVISRYLHNVNTRLFCTADRMFRTIIMQNSRLIYACFPIKIDEVWIDWFCVRYDWWRRLQRTSSVSPVWMSAMLNTAYTNLVTRYHTDNANFIRSEWRQLWHHFHGLVQERRNSSANALELRLSSANALELRLYCTNPLTWWFEGLSCWQPTLNCLK